ncbi:MAG: DASS family sodium-coupled anion symporter [Chitinophagaceae bacterium]|nr:DASS family sodium-coupled anion symporter [Chitinophagaceae bacterium]
MIIPTDLEKQNANGSWGKNKSLYLFLITFVVAFILTLLIKEPGFTDSQVYVLFLLFFAVGLWITEAIPAFAVSLFIIAYLVFALGNKHFNASPENIDIYVRTFSDSIIWLLLGGFFLAKAMAKTKLDETLFRFTLKIAGTNPRNIIIGVMIITMLVSMVLSNTATTSMVLAAVLPLIKLLDKNRNFAKGLLLGIPLASTAGGIATIIGTPANAIAAGALQNNGVTIEFLDWMIYGTPIAVFITVVSCFVLIKTYVKDTTPISFPDLNESEKSEGSSLHRKIVIAVILVTVGLWLTTSLHGMKVASVCAIPLVIFTLTGVLDGKDVRSMAWDTLLLVAGGISLGLSLEHTGLLEHYAAMLISLELTSIVLLTIFGFLAMLLANVMTNSTATAIMVPICMAILPALKLEAAMIVAISSSAALVLLASSPSNAIIYSTGLVEQKDFRYTGILVGILGPLLTILWVLFLS